MAIIRVANKADYTFKAGPYIGDKLKVLRFSGTEEISRLFQFKIDLISTDGEIDYDQLIRQPGLLAIRGGAGLRYLHGIISRFEQTGKEGGWTRYRAEVVPAVWTLSRRANCRIFQNQNVPDIIKKVLTDGGITSDQFRFSIRKSYASREFCVQYRESDLSFITRLMEQYGLFYFFEHTPEADVMIIGDDPVVHVPVPDPSRVTYRAPGTSGVSDQEHIFEYCYNREIQTGAVRLRDFDFKKPGLNLEQEAGGDEDANLEVYDYPGEYLLPDEGGDLARIRLEELQAKGQIGSGQSDCRRLIPGYRFSLVQHDRSDFNREYLLTRVSQNGSQIQVLGADAAGRKGEGTIYQNQFECIPSDVPFRPARITKTPVVQGPQTAIVVGPKGEEIYTDHLGRVKVQFHWDREGKQDEKSSCWIRVAQLWAGASWGAMFLPRIGQEVIVDFLEGDPDQPIITGRVYNGDNMPPYALPVEKTKSTIKSDSSKGGGGSNEIRFEDDKGKEEFFIHAQKDMNEQVENDMSTSVGSDQAVSVGNNQTVTVKKERKVTVEEGNDSLDISSGKQTVTVKGDAGLTVQAGKREVSVRGGDYSASTDQSVHLQATKGVLVTGTSEGVSIKGEGKGITAEGLGGSGVKITGTPNFEANGVSKAVVNSPDIDIGNGTIKLHGSRIELSVGGNSIVIDSSGITINGAAVNSIASGANTIQGGSITAQTGGIHTIIGAVVKIN